MAKADAVSKLEKAQAQITQALEDAANVADGLRASPPDGTDAGFIRAHAKSIRGSGPRARSIIQPLLDHVRGAADGDS